MAANIQLEDRKIQRVPGFFRDAEHGRDVYDPKVVSFGPYHHGEPELHLCQTAKPLTLEMFLEGSGQTVEFFKGEVLKIIQYARSCYIDGSTVQYTDDYFAEMMILDATFLIFLIGLTDAQNDHLWIPIYNFLGKLVYYLVQRDMFLLENQIPFRVLMLLINLRYGIEEGAESVSKFLHNTIWGHYTHQESKEVQEQQIQEIQQQQSQRPPLHLLEAFRGVLVWDRTPSDDTIIPIIDQAEDFDERKLYKTFRSAKALKAKGIYFKPSCNKSLKAIKFNSFTFYGELELPVWFVSSLSKVFFPNMVAYELCPDNNRVGDTTVVSYLAFMKSLIECPADVKELREKRILITTLGSDEDVVRLYESIDTFESQDTYSFLEVELRVQEHYDSKGKTWKAELIHTYLGSPWSIIAWLAGLMLLVLAMVQTYFTVHPRK